MKSSNPIQLVTGDSSGKGLDKKVDNFNGSTKKYISRYYIRMRDLKIEEIKQILSVNNSPSDNEVQAEFKTCVYLKKTLKHWVRNRIRQIQFEEAKKQGMDVQSWEDIGANWQTDGSLENQKCLFQIMHGVFERNKNWSVDQTWSSQLEGEFMKEYSLKYDKPEPERKEAKKRVPAGIEEIIKGERPAINKLLNKRTKIKGSHGKTIVVVGIVGKCEKVPNGCVRKKGVFYPDYVPYYKNYESVDGMQNNNAKNAMEAMVQKNNHG